MHGFFTNASGMLRANGEIYVTHKIKAPFSDWNLEELAAQNSLVLFDCVAFRREDYPGYNNKRGAGSRCDEAFNLGVCSTFKSGFLSSANKMLRIENYFVLNHRGSRQLNLTEMQQGRSSFDCRGPGTNSLENMNCILSLSGLPLTTTVSIDCSRIFSGFVFGKH